MMANATNSSKLTMDCARVSREEILEAYLLGRLSEEDRGAFEEHYFDCVGCFDELQTLRAVRDELARTRTEPGPRTRLFPWAGIAVFATAAIVIIGFALSLRERSASREATTAQATVRPQPERNSSKPPTSQSPPGPTLEQLARVEPALYEPGNLRGPLDEATQRFRRGMEHYRKADYTTAVDDLRDARDLDPLGLTSGFFCVSQLMSGQDGPAIESLLQDDFARDSPYLEEAHFYLAKPFFDKHNSMLLHSN